jgi:hypothetical protein
VRVAAAFNKSPRQPTNGQQVKPLAYPVTVLAGLMVLFGAAEDGMVFGIGSAQARVGRPLTPMSYAGVARRTTRRAYRRGYYYGGYHY